MISKLNMKYEEQFSTEQFKNLYKLSKILLIKKIQIEI
jgi:hypothetical protein